MLPITTAPGPQEAMTSRQLLQHCLQPASLVPLIQLCNQVLCILLCSTW